MFSHLLKVNIDQVIFAQICQAEKKKKISYLTFSNDFILQFLSNLYFWKFRFLL